MKRLEHGNLEQIKALKKANKLSGDRHLDNEDTECGYLNVEEGHDCNCCHCDEHDVNIDIEFNCHYCNATTMWSDAGSSYGVEDTSIDIENGDYNRNLECCQCGIQHVAVKDSSDADEAVFTIYPEMYEEAYYVTNNPKQTKLKL